MIRILTLAGGIAGAASAAQFPAYSDQYAQRLGGAIDELRTVVEDFDKTAQASDLSRETALRQMTGTAFLEGRQSDMRRSFRRYDDLLQAQSALAGAAPFERLARLNHFTDPKVARAAWQEFKPALPATSEGIGFAMLGFVAGLFLFGALIKLIVWPFRRRGTADAEG